MGVNKQPGFYWEAGFPGSQSKMSTFKDKNSMYALFDGRMSIKEATKYILGASAYVPSRNKALY